MEIKNVPSFVQTNEIVFELINIDQDNSKSVAVLSTIGKWLDIFLNSNEKNISLKIPHYKKEEMSLIQTYIFTFDLVRKILCASKVTKFEGTALFDFLAYSNALKSNRLSKQYSLDYCNYSSNILSFKDSVSIADDRFFPVFYPEQIVKNKEIIFRSFKILKVIAKKLLRNHPIQIDLNKDLSFFISQNILPPKANILSTFVNTVSFKSDLERNSFIGKISKDDVLSCYMIKYPYHQNINSVYYNIFKKRSKIFTLDMNERLFQKDILDEQIILLPEELEGKDFNIFSFISCYTVIKTDHSQDLFDKLKGLRDNWQDFEFNSFNMPFPSKWLMFIHQGRSLSFWISLFKSDYPNVKGQLLTELVSLIESFFYLDWLSKYLPSGSEHMIVVVPNMPQFPVLSQSTYQYLSKKFKKVLSWDQIKFCEPDMLSEIWILDPFNILHLSNYASMFEFYKTRILVPDIFYFSCRPFLKFYLAKFKYDCLLKGVRERLDPRYNDNNLIWNSESKKLIQSIKEETTTYLSRFHTIQVEVESLEVEDEVEYLTDHQSDLVESEIFELFSNRVTKFSKNGSSTYYEVITRCGQSIQLSPTDPILLEMNGKIFNASALNLEVKSRFIPISKIKRSININTLAERLSEVSDKSFNWRYQLYCLNLEDRNLYKNLTMHGLRVRKERFDDFYLMASKLEKDVDLFLPRSRNNWDLISKTLGLTDSGRTWIAGRCKGDLNKLRQTYVMVISFLIESDNLGDYVSDEVISHVSTLIDRYIDRSDISEETKSYDARTIISAVNRNIKLFEVTHINPFI